MAATMFTAKPTFHGPNGKTTAEDFLRRVENMAASAVPAWGADVAAAKAVSFLRDDANAWLEGMRLVDATRYEAIRTDFEVFKREFKRAFFSMTTCEDVSMCWTTMKQGDKEPVNMFCYKVVQAMDKYIQLLPFRHVPQPNLDAFRAALDAFEQDQSAANRQAVLAAHNTNVTLAGVSNKEAVGQDLAMKFAAEGIRANKLKEKARSELRKRMSTFDTIQALVEAEKVLAGTPNQDVKNGQRNGGHQRGNGNGNPFAGVADVDNNGENQDDPVDAVQKPKTNLAGGSANANQGSAFQQWRSTARCFNCNATGHLRSECNRPPRGVAASDEYADNNTLYANTHYANEGPYQAVSGLRDGRYGAGGHGGGGGRGGAGRAGYQSGNA